MSGGHFNYDDNRIDNMMDIIKYDIKYNDVEWDYNSETGESVEDYGFQHSKETIAILKKLLKDINYPRYKYRGIVGNCNPKLNSLSLETETTLPKNI